MTRKLLQSQLRDMWLTLLLLVYWTASRLAETQMLPPSQSPCGANFGGCDRENGLCWGTSETTHFCTCKSGFRQDTNHENHICADIDECAEGLCPGNSFCENKQGSYHCHCQCGYTLDYTGEHCLSPYVTQGICHIPSKCYSFYRNESLPVVPFGIYDGSDYVTDEYSAEAIKQDDDVGSCDCEVGFRKNACGYCDDIDECTEDSHDCSGEGSVCRNTEGHYICECQQGYASCGKRSVSTESDGVWENGQETEDVALDRSWCDSLRDNNFVNDDFLRLVCDSEQSKRDRIAKPDAWDEWTCWTTCKLTCWGGLQTRTRRCKGVIGVDCKGKGSESRECYMGPKCPFRVRKDATTLTSEEQDDLIQAMKKFRQDTSVTGFHNAASSHGWPKQCGGEECCPHGARMKFLSWHRTTMLNYEKGLSRYLKNRRLGLPYWNWLAKDQTPPKLAWDSEIDNQPNPFANITVRIDLEGPMRAVQRDPTIDLTTMKMAYNKWVGVTTSLMKPNTMEEFSESLESVHNNPHAAVCRGGDRCELSMGSIFFAAFDPIFVFHHTQIDRLWAVFQKTLEDQNETAWTLDAVIEAGEKKSDFGRSQMPFGNHTINPYPILKAVNNMRDSYYYKELTGVMYDFLGNDGMPRTEPEGHKAFHEILIAHYLESFPGTRPVYVNYYEAAPAQHCSSLQENRRIGGSILLPTQRVFRNAVPNLLPAQMRSNPKKSRDIKLKACYTYQPDCTSKCPSARNTVLQRMTTPLLVQRRINSQSELYKFNWSPNNIMPWWRINFQSNAQFLYFFGSRAKHIYLVKSHNEWRECDVSNARRFRCREKSLCKLSVGIYFILDKDPRLCKKGLRMIAVSTL